MVQRIIFRVTAANCILFSFPQSNAKKEKDLYLPRKKLGLQFTYYINDVVDKRRIIII